MPVDLALDRDQQELQQAAHDFFSHACPTSVVRDIEAGDVGYVPATWQEMVDKGWVGLTVPDAYGGGGGRFLDLYPIFEEMGRFIMPSPFLDTYLVAEVVARTGTEAQQRGVLRAIASEAAIATPALLEPNGAFGADGITLSARAQGDGYVLDGTKLLVGFVPAARWVLVAARTSGDTGTDGITLFLVDPAADGVTTTPLVNIAAGALYAVDLADVAVPADGVVGEVGGGFGPLSEAITRAAVLQTASIVGAGQAVLAMTAQYAKDREQFGGPIGRYQAVQYMVTDVLIDMHRADLLNKQAAYRIDSGRSFGREAAMAIAFGKQAGAHLHRQAHEVHAGNGFMNRHDITLFSRRSKFWENNLGDARYWHERLAVELEL